jgi:hypothetical protein
MKQDGLIVIGDDTPEPGRILAPTYMGEIKDYYVNDAGSVHLRLGTPQSSTEIEFKATGSQLTRLALQLEEKAGQSMPIVELFTDRVVPIKLHEKPVTVQSDNVGHTRTQTKRTITLTVDLTGTQSMTMNGVERITMLLDFEDLVECVASNVSDWDVAMVKNKEIEALREQRADLKQAEEETRTARTRLDTARRDVSDTLKLDYDRLGRVGKWAHRYLYGKR